ncbi:MAG TPA: class I SAM-dependent methyltransferase [Verrucomicrobiae bacterium]|nr:class I SAM-dependent methyltransferase [Verrucomicrobiae bacterium]
MLSLNTRPKNPAVARLRLRVTATAETLLRGGHPWLFADSIKEQNREGKTGELAVIYDRKDEFLAVGLYDADSPIRVRVLHSGKPQTIDRHWWLRRLKGALEKRLAVFDSASPNFKPETLNSKPAQPTTAYRCINGESDGWPGLVLDRYDTTLVLKLYSGAWLARLDEITELLAERVPNERIVLRLSRNIQEKAASEFQRSDGQILRGESLSGPVIFLETGLRFEADVLRGQKTGFFLDQRENRRWVESLAKGRAMLNAFSFSGGFSLYAARGGAKSVTDLDISAHALAGAKRNFALNASIAEVARCPHEMVQADAFEWLAETKRRFDLIVLDPPSLAKREPERAGAIRAYSRLAAMGIRALERGGILVAASCSAHVSAPEFFAAVREAAAKSGRKFSELRTIGHAFDHAANFKEGEYLKAIYLQVH